MPTPFSSLRRRSLIAAAAAPWLASAWQAAQAQSWPSKPIRLVVPFAPGGASDTIARLISDQLPRRLGQPVVIDNKPGGSTIIGVDAVAKAAPDGYTLLLAGVGSYSVLPALRKNLPFQIDRDLAMLALVSYTPNVLVTASNKPYASLADFIRQAKARPGDLRYVTYGEGGANHLCGVMLENAAGIKMDAIPYKGAADAKLALLRGDVDLSFETLASVGGELRSGRLRALAIGSPERSKLLPSVASLTELGLGQAAVQPFFGFSMPSGTPQAIRDRLSRELIDIMSQAEARDRSTAAFLEPVALGPDDMRTLVNRETESFRRVAQQLKLNLD